MIEELVKVCGYRPTENCCLHCKHFGMEDIFRHRITVCNHPRFAEEVPWNKEVSLDCICNFFERDGVS